jgi:hypothetical protein
MIAEGLRRNFSAGTLMRGERRAARFGVAPRMAADSFAKGSLVTVVTFRSLL